MANMYDITPISYQPSTNMDWFTQAIFGGKLIDTGKITPMSGVKESTLLNLLEFTSGVLQPDGRDCAWTPEQIAKLSEKELKIKTYKINLEQCIDDLEKNRLVWMLKPGAKNVELPDTLEEATLAILSKEVSKEIETMIFNGNSAIRPNDFDGAVKVLTDSADSVKITGVQLTKANVLDEIEKLFEAIPSNVLQKGMENGSLAIYMSYETHTRVKMALAKVFNNNVVIDSNYTVDGDVIKYMGVEMVSVFGLDNSTMIAGEISNFILGTDLLSDYENIRIGQFAAPHDSKVYIDGRLRIGFAVPFENEAVIYSPNVESTNTEEEIEEASIASPISAQTGEVGYDGVSLVVDGIDQTPVHRLPKVGDLTAHIKASESIEDIEVILDIEAHTLRNSPTLKQEGETRIKELKGGE